MPRQMILRVCGGSVKLGLSSDGWWLTSLRHDLHQSTSCITGPFVTHRCIKLLPLNGPFGMFHCGGRPPPDLGRLRKRPLGNQSPTLPTTETLLMEFMEVVYWSISISIMQILVIEALSAEQCYISRTNAIITHHWHSPLLARSHPSNMGSFETKVIPQSHMIPVGGRSSAWSFLSYSTGSSYQLMSRSNIDLRYHSCHYCHGGIRLGRAG